MEYWEKVEAFEKKGLTTSALQQVNLIYERAKSEKNDPQIIKSLLYKNKLSVNLTEDAIKNMIDTLESEVIVLPEPAKSVLRSITAQLYQNYLSFNRYKLYSVTTTEGFQKEDVATWSLSDLRNRISELYEESLKNEQLQKIPVSAFDAVIEKGNSRNLRPTLFDLLAHRALDYFKSSENDINRPSYSFEITDPAAFAPAKDFVSHDFVSLDTTSSQLHALRIFQRLIKFHLNAPAPLIDVDLERLAFINERATMPDKKNLYIAALKRVFENHQVAGAGEAGVLWALQVAADAEETGTRQNEQALVQAISILKKVTERFPATNAAVEAQNQIHQIEQPTLNLQIEKVNERNKPFRALVSYSNTDEVFFRVIRVTKKQKDELRAETDNNKRFKLMSALPVLKAWRQELPRIDDYREHRVEVKVDGLPSGEYMLLAGLDKDFSTAKNSMAANFFFVSDISYVNNGKNFFVLYRQSGKPIQNAQVVVMEGKYNYKTRRYEHQQIARTQTNTNGFFRLPESAPERRNNTLLDITHGDDRLYLDDYERTYVYNPYRTPVIYKSQQEADASQARIFFFTDRSIYRPGQVVYYKGIGITQERNSRKTMLLKRTLPLKIFLFNANNEKVDSATATLNEYGSFSGKFTLPENQLTGSYRIAVTEYRGQQYSFSVEEYKRPMFFSELNQPKQTYKINDTVRVTGKAEAYTGTAVGGARVSYRVTRVARFIYPWRFWRIGFPQITPMEIAHGETITGEQGEFHLTFKAIPDLKIDPTTEPVFDYNVKVDVTDINGETRSASIVIPVGYKALDLQIGMAQNATLENLKELTVTAKNLSGEPQDVVADVRIFRLNPPDRLLRERLWQAPDTAVMSRDEYIRNFPHDVYRDEDKPETWSRTDLLFSTEDSIRGSGNISIKNNLTTGWYVAEATSNDRFGREVKDVKFFRIIKPAGHNLNLSDYMIAAAETRSHEPGDTAKIIVGTGADIFLIQQQDTIIRGDEDKPEFQFYLLNNQSRTFSFPVTEHERGGFGVINFFVKDNRFYSTNTIVNVPWTNKQLDISFETFREKTMPGSEERWTVKVAGAKGEKMAAEMLVSMYDASLDQFKAHRWNAMQIWPVYGTFNTWQSSRNFSAVGSLTYSSPPPSGAVKVKTYDQIVPLDGAPGRIFYRPEMRFDKVVSGAAPAELKAETDANRVMAPTAQAEADDLDTEGEPSGIAPPLRRNFNETAFFFPALTTDKDGNVSFSFTMPEALTTWKLMAQAHTKELATGYAEKMVVTRKDLMVIPNAPRFLREGDRVDFSAKLVNASDKNLTVEVGFHLLNATTLHPVDSWFQHSVQTKKIDVAANTSEPVHFQIEVPRGFNDVVIYRIVASSENLSDGEEAFIPVVTNRMLVTESLPLELRGPGTKNFVFEKLLKSGNSTTLSNYGLTVEYTTNPAWYAVQALPYLNATPGESTEQIFNRYFANALAMNIANSSPRLKSIFEKWKNQDTAALMSNLEKNQELKSVLLEETPWVLQAKTEEEQKRNIALLFDLSNMSAQLDAALKTVQERQSPNGGFVWMKNGPDDRYMTQYIVADIGHLKKLKAWPDKNEQVLNQIASRALVYLDNRIAEDYARLKKSKANMENNQPSTLTAHYLYTRSFFNEIPVLAAAREAYAYYLGQAKKYWLKQSIYSQGMLALALFRSGDSHTAQSIVRSLKENAIVNETLGMYWKAWGPRGWWWYQAPIESQALMIEAFTDITKDMDAVAAMKTWLLKHKQTNNWKTTKATAEAVYALLLQGADWLSKESHVVIKTGDLVFDSRSEKQEQGTGYFKRMIDGSRVKPEMGKISVTVTDESGREERSPSWGAVYWQYFEELDKISFAETPLKLSKKLFVERNTDRGPVLTPVNEGDPVRIGDKLISRIELRVDRDMEYVHMKDMRASAMEPVNVISSHKSQGGLRYYESTRDVSTNFFFSYLPRGTYVFEYPMFVTHSGDFSNGITTIQSMYAPEFSAHSEGVRLLVK